MGTRLQDCGEKRRQFAKVSWKMIVKKLMKFDFYRAWRNSFSSTVYLGSRRARNYLAILRDSVQLYHERLTG